jgi:small subunit ribosomal protein S1
VYECVVVGVNRGGLMVEVEGIKGFLPSSHLSARVANLEDLMGKTVRAKVLEADAEGGRLVMSNRRANEGEKKTFNVGDVLLGTVQSVQPYGAFVDIPGGNSGLLHISQISNERVTDVASVLAVGDKIKVMVLSHENDKGKLSLTTRKLEPSPGDMLRNPKRVFERAEEMAATFRQRVAVAEAAAAADEAAAAAPK